MSEKVIPTVQTDAANSPALAAVLQFQKELGEARAEVIRLESAIQAQRDGAEKLQREVPDLGELDSAREALLARIVIGEADREELAELDAKQEEARVNAATMKVRAELIERESSQAVAGLGKLLDTARQHLASLQRQEQKLVSALIHERRTQVYGEFLQAAAEARDAYLLLIGLARLEGDERHFSQFYRISSDLELPKFDFIEAAQPPVLPQLKGYKLDFDSQFFSSRSFLSWHPDWHIRSARIEGERLREQGVTLKLNH